MRLLAAACLLPVVTAVAAEEPIERTLPFTSFHFESSARADYGRVTVAGEQSSTGISAMRITAFGRSFSLSSQHIRELRGLPINSVAISGYREDPASGGRHVVLLLSSGFASGASQAKIVDVDEQGHINVRNAAK